MPTDRKCWDDVEVRSVDDVQRSVDAAAKILDWLEYSSLIGTLAPCRADTGGSALPACSLRARECLASVTPGASVVIVPDQTSWCRWRLVQQRLTLVVACLLLSSDASELTKMIKAGRADTGNVFANYSIVCLSPMRIRREMAYLVEQHDSADGHKWKQCCETNRTTGVPDVSSPVKNITCVTLWSLC